MYFRSIHWIWILGTVLSDLTNMNWSTLVLGQWNMFCFRLNHIKTKRWGILDQIPWCVPKCWGKEKRIKILRLEKFAKHSTLERNSIEKSFWLCNQTWIYISHLSPHWYPFPSPNCKICYGEGVNIPPLAKYGWLWFLRCSDPQTNHI